MVILAGRKSRQEECGGLLGGGGGAGGLTLAPVVRLEDRRGRVAVVWHVEKLWRESCS